MSAGVIFFFYILFLFIYTAGYVQPKAGWDDEKQKI